MSENQRLVRGMNTMDQIIAFECGIEKNRRADLHFQRENRDNNSNTSQTGYHGMMPLGSGIDLPLYQERYSGCNREYRFRGVVK
jgi:hypothetical protein